MSKKTKKVYAKLIANPGAAEKTGRVKLFEEITRELKTLGLTVDVALAKPHEEAVAIARRAVKDGYKIIIAVGGDDTIEAVIRGMNGSKAHLGIIAGGTANNLAKTLGIPEDPMQACALIASGQFRKLDLGRVKVGGRKKVLFFELVTIGIAAAVYPDAMHASKGRLSSVKNAIETVLKHESKPKVTVIMDGDSSVTVESMLAVVSNVPLLGTSMLVDPDSSLDDGLLDVSLYPNFSKAELLAYSSKINHQGKTADGGIQRYRAHKLKIKTSPELEVMADGVMLGTGTVKIKLLPGALRVIAPPVGAGVEKAPSAAAVEMPPPISPIVVGNVTDKDPAPMLDGQRAERIFQRR